jgi:hypothetical protein
MLPQPMISGPRSATSVVDGATIESRIHINRPDDESTRCKVLRAWDPRKDFSQCMPQPTTSSTSSAISPQQERTEPSGHRPCRRGTTSSLQREPDVPRDLLRALFGNVTKPWRSMIFPPSIGNTYGPRIPSKVRSPPCVIERSVRKFACRTRPPSPWCSSSSKARRKRGDVSTDKTCCQNSSPM